MAQRHFWKVYKTPDGEKYYYNIKTKQSTRERPAELDAASKDEGEDVPTKNKLRKLGPRAVHSVKLLNDWFLVVFDDGSRRFKRQESGDFQDELPDEDSIHLMSKLPAGQLDQLCFAAKTGQGKENPAYQETLAEISALRGDTAKDPFTWKKEEETSTTKNVEIVSFNGTSDSEPVSSNEIKLVSGYDSSDDDNEIQSADEDPVLESVQNTGILEEEFTSLFVEYSLDPYSTWSLQSKKIQDDARFYTISNDTKRAELFEKWCTRQAQEAPNILDANEENEVSAEYSDDEADSLEPTKYHYLSHIVSKAIVSPSSLPKDIRSQNKPLFKQFKIKSSLDKKTQDAFISKLLFYYKRLSQDQRTEVFEKLLSEKSKTISRGLRNSDKLKEIVSESELPTESYAIETQLLTLEHCMGLHGPNGSLQEEVRYYVLDIKTKTQVLKKFLEGMLK
ncbi:LADA_0G14642g1_1 [Lachancea dasiensis]|uniref:LADA_0G14642g1_1 n=1 Tax=Lachancea dasiensis TaxID=1072105 RepID=A0A1G4JW25_9SACH|nr:LADA_0G14642g1_1 [Lachancea dasiensis]